MNQQRLPASDAFHVRAGAEAVSHARRRISMLARDWDVPLTDTALADVELCASEVITNALTHAGSECWVRTHWTGQFLQVDVTDRSLRPPVASDASLDALSGRGLTLVDNFSHGWGWVPKESGKTVFFIVADEAVLTGTRRLSALVRIAQARIEKAQNGTRTPSARCAQRYPPTTVPRRVSCLG